MHAALIASFGVRSKVLTYVSDGDTNGLFHFLGTNFDVAAWTNPHTAGRVTIGAFNSSNASDIEQGTVAGAVNLDYTDENRTSNNAGGYWRADVGAARKIAVSKYSIKCRPSGVDTDSNIGQFKFQGSANGSSWSDLDTRSGITYASSDEWKTFTVASPVAYRYNRILHQANTTGANQFFFLTEFEFYGTFYY